MVVLLFQTTAELNRIRVVLRNTSSSYINFIQIVTEAEATIQPWLLWCWLFIQHILKTRDEYMMQLNCGGYYSYWYMIKHSLDKD